jgi:hypothetical protein
MTRVVVMTVLVVLAMVVVLAIIGTFAQLRRSVTGAPWWGHN